MVAEWHVVCDARQKMIEDLSNLKAAREPDSAMVACAYIAKALVRLSVRASLVIQKASVRFQEANRKELAEMDVFIQSAARAVCEAKYTACWTLLQKAFEFLNKALTSREVETAMQKEALDDLRSRPMAQAVACPSAAGFGRFMEKAALDTAIAETSKIAVLVTKATEAIEAIEFVSEGNSAEVNPFQENYKALWNALNDLKFLSMNDENYKALEKDTDGTNMPLAAAFASIMKAYIETFLKNNSWFKKMVSTTAKVNAKHNVIDWPSKIPDIETQEEAELKFACEVVEVASGMDLFLSSAQDVVATLLEARCFSEVVKLGAQRYKVHLGKHVLFL